jgi:hypothetical protein
MVTVSAYAPPAGQVKRIGFLEGLDVPDDFDSIGKDEIRAMFEASE